MVDPDARAERKIASETETLDLTEKCEKQYPALQAKPEEMQMEHTLANFEVESCHFPVIYRMAHELGVGVGLEGRA